MGAEKRAKFPILKNTFLDASQVLVDSLAYSSMNQLEAVEARSIHGILIASPFPSSIILSQNKVFVLLVGWYESVFKSKVVNAFEYRCLYNNRLQILLAAK
jgi:hypothetical protein